MTEPKTYTLDAPGAVLHYDVRSASRSKRTDGASQTTPDEHADDLHRLISALDAGPVDIFASSGGAVNALALVAKHPEQVRTLVAHEPPASVEVPDHEAVLAACAGIRETYYRSGFGPAMAKFIAIVSHEGPFPDGYADQPGPDPAMFGLPAEDDASRVDPLLSHNIITCNAYRHDFDALRKAPTRIVIGVGAKSGQQLAGRAGAPVAGRLGIAPVTFPGDHGGFLGGEYGQTGAVGGEHPSRRGAPGHRGGGAERGAPESQRAAVERQHGYWLGRLCFP